MHTVFMLLSAAATINAWTAPTKAVHKLRVPPRRDEDRCFYGEVGVDGSVVADVAQPRADTVPPKPPSPELSPLDVVGEQFRALEREDVSHAYKFVHESIKEQYSLDVDRYEQIFKGAAYDGLLGCASRTVHKSNFAPDCSIRAQVLEGHRAVAVPDRRRPDRRFDDRAPEAGPGVRQGGRSRRPARHHVAHVLQVGTAETKRRLLDDREHDSGAAADRYRGDGRDAATRVRVCHGGAIR